MSWCSACQRGFEPAGGTVGGAADGMAGGTAPVECPTCGGAIEVVTDTVCEMDDSTCQNKRRTGGPPWHFWVVVGAATIYLGWRALEGLVWVVRWIQ